MRIGAIVDMGRPVEEVAAQVRGFADQGFSSVWANQVFGYDALTLWAALGNGAPGIELGTAVVPVYGRHPQVLAQQALTAQAACGGRIVLGVGLSHQVVVEGLWGYRYDRPARYMREYLSALLPMLAGEAVSFSGDVVTAVTYAPLEIPVPGPPVLVAALGSTMLALAGRTTSGTVTWMTGVRTVGTHVVPTISEAADAAGRPAPRIVVSLPVTVTSDRESACRRIDESFAIYPTLPSYKAMLDREGAERPSDIAVIGDAAEVTGKLAALAEAGTTDFVAAIVGDTEERERTAERLAAYRD